MKRRYSEIATIPSREQPATTPYGISSAFDSGLLQVLLHNYLAPMSTAVVRIVIASSSLISVACFPGPVPSPGPDVGPDAPAPTPTATTPSVPITPTPAP